MRAEGFAYDRQEYQEGIEAIACPVFYPESLRILGALSIPPIASPEIRERIYSQKTWVQDCAAKLGYSYKQIDEQIWDF
ncbi:MAG: IclR family transcriptional regulator C-terminal domain-containing protein [Spirochaetota bacterium]